MAFGFLKRKKQETLPPSQADREQIKTKLESIKKSSTVDQKDQKELVSGIAKGDSG